MVVPEFDPKKGLLDDCDVRLEVADQLLKRSDPLVEMMVENMVEG